MGTTLTPLPTFSDVSRRVRYLGRKHVRFHADNVEFIRATEPLFEEGGLSIIVRTLVEVASHNRGDGNRDVADHLEAAVGQVNTARAKIAFKAARVDREHIFGAWRADPGGFEACLDTIEEAAGQLGTTHLADPIVAAVKRLREGPRGGM